MRIRASEGLGGGGDEGKSRMIACRGVLGSLVESDEGD